MRRIITFTVFFCLIVVNAFCEGPALLPVSLIAHRGLITEVPENSIAALEAAWKAGIHGSEIDVRTSADGVPVLLHDATLDRTTEGAGNVDEKTWDQLENMRLVDSQGQASDQTLPRLEQALEWLEKRPGFSLALDMKQVDHVAVGRMVLEHGLADRVTLSVGGTDRAEMVRAIEDFNPRLKNSLSLGWWWRIEGMPAFAAKGLGVDALFAPEYYFQARGFSEAMEAGAHIAVFLRGKDNLPERLHKAAALGAQAVSSDDPVQLLPLVVPRENVIDNKRKDIAQKVERDN